MFTSILINDAYRNLDGHILCYRIQQQKIVDGKAEYTGFIDVASTLIKTEGVTALWKGWPFYYLRIAPGTVLLFIFMEQMNNGYRKYIMNETIEN